jgi:hypothetical protein
MIFQNRGIGTALIGDFARQSRAAGRPLCLWVLSVDPARRLYERKDPGGRDDAYRAGLPRLTRGIQRDTWRW